MPFDPETHKGRLRRLAPKYYEGLSFVHWSMAMESRKTGWLDDIHASQLRELMCHSLGRFELICPAYCLMPDHVHFLWMGMTELSDQKKAMRHFRRSWSEVLVSRGFALQKQPFDHVLRENERKRDAFTKVAYYIFENPVRARLVESWKDYQYVGSVVPGYPSLDPRMDGYWDRFWRIYEILVGETKKAEILTNSATGTKPQSR